MLSRIPGTTWWSLSGFIQAVQREDPDFQRPAGDYESWFIRDRQSGSFLHGFSSWETVDGGLLRFFMTGILHWLGIVSLASPSQEAEPEAFRITDWAADLLVGKPPSGLPAEAGKIKLVSNGKVVMPRLTPRAVHYQIARFCDWEKETVRDYHYRITHESLARAKAQGLKIEQILGLLVRNSAAPPPPNIRKALERWDEHGVQASLETRTILHVYDPHQIELLRKSRASRYLDEQLNPTTILLRPGGNAVVGEVLAEIGFLAEDRTENRDASA
jgi:hypothetical protein